MSTTYTDVLVVGSGFGAAPPALRLAEAGYRVVVVEKGPNIDAPTGFRQTQDPNYLRRYLKSLSGSRIGMTYAEALGGGSGFYEMVSLRAPSAVFEQCDGGGRRLWPEGVDRAALDPHYDTAEAMLRVDQITADRVPKTGLVFARMMKNLGYSCDRARYAVQGCVGSGFCVTGCIYGAKQSLHMNYLPRAVEAGAVIETDVSALAIRPLGGARRHRPGRPISELPYRYEVICRSRTHNRRRFRARLVVLAGGTVGSARLLLASRSQLPDLSPAVGCNIAFNGSVKVAGLLPSDFPDADMFTGQSHPGMISYEFLESHGITVAAAKPMPLQIVAAARLRLDGDTRNPWHWGEPNVELMRQCRTRMMVLYSLGMTPPAARLTLDDGRKPRLELDPSDELASYYYRTRELLESILVDNGCRLVRAEFVDGAGFPHKEFFFATAHQTGSCRMATSPRLGVTDAAGEVFGYPGLYVSDGASIPSSLAVNTSLTILANAERIAAGILERHQPPADRSAGRREPVTARIATLGLTSA